MAVDSLHPDDIVILFIRSLPFPYLGAFMGKGNEIFINKYRTPVKVPDLARRMIRLAGLVLTRMHKFNTGGLRQGEKLYEELLAIEENTLPTLNEKIYRAQVREYDFKEINELMDPLVHLAVCVDKVRTVKLMKEIVPEFKSKNSEYEALDK